MENNVIEFDKLEELLLAHWSEFIDSSRLIALCLKHIRDNKNSFPKDNKSLGLSSTTLQIMVSRFQITLEGFIIWLEFRVPMLPCIAVGTSEFLLKTTGNLLHIQTLGTLYDI